MENNIDKENNINKENTIVAESTTVNKSQLDEDLISAVQKRHALYDHRIPLKERWRQKKMIYGKTW